MPFPADRFTRAGATPDQLATLQEEYDALSPEAQAAYDARIAPLSDYGVAELLAEPVAKAEEESEVEVVTPDSSKSSSSSSSSSSSASSGSDSSK